MRDGGRIAGTGRADTVPGMETTTSSTGLALVVDDVDSYIARAAAYGIIPLDARAAWANLTDGVSFGIGVNGKLASGKDTVAPAVLAALGIDDAEHIYFAHPLKIEMSEAIEIVRGHEHPDMAAVDVARICDIPDRQANLIVGLLWTPTHDAEAGPTLDGWSRHPGVRTALQYWGTEIRRAVDELYWVKKAMQVTYGALAEGRCVYVTDMRFPNEADAANDAGLHTIRLDITPETQRARLAGRDGLEIDEAALVHESELALDDYDRFGLRIDNNGPLEPTVDTIVAHVTTR